MRALHLIASLALASTLSFGCSIADELDAAHAEMERYDNNIEEKKTEKAKAKEKAAQPEKPDFLAGWRDKTSLSTDYDDGAIVTCQLDGRSQFMNESDCISQGGRVR